MKPIHQVFAAVLLFGDVLLAQADAWTNQAGRIIEGRLAGFDGITATFVRTNGVEMRVPLSALSKADQQRVYQQKSLSVAPPFVIAAYKDALTVLEKYQRLPPEQQTSEALKAASQMACAIFDGRLQPRQAELRDNAVRDEVNRIRSLLALKTEPSPAFEAGKPESPPGAAGAGPATR